MGKTRIRRKHEKLRENALQSGLIVAQHQLPKKYRLELGKCYQLITMNIRTVSELMEATPEDLAGVAEYFEPAEFVASVKKMFSHIIFKDCVPKHWR